LKIEVKKLDIDLPGFATLTVSLATIERFEGYAEDGTPLPGSTTADFVAPPPDRSRTSA
jgi:hypothetical protein